MTCVPDGPPPRLAELIALQHAALSRRQLRALGCTDGWIAAQVTAGRWSRGPRGVYVTHTGPRTPHTRLWVALLYAGQGAVASHHAAGWLAGLCDELPAAVDVTVPTHRRVRRLAEVVPHRSAHLGSRRHPARHPPQTRVEDTVLDLVEACERAEDVVGWLTRAAQRRLTTATRLAAAAAERPKLRWRQLVAEVLEDVADGVLSAMERRWARDVEAAHGLPRGERNRPEGRPGRRRYRDVRYRRQRVVVELDGREAHPAEDRRAEAARDRELVEAEQALILHYGWADVAGAPCATAAQVIRVLRGRGWSGQVRPCRPGCCVAGL